MCMYRSFYILLYSSFRILFCLFDHARPGHLSNKLDLAMVFQKKKISYYFSVCSSVLYYAMLDLAIGQLARESAHHAKPASAIWLGSRKVNTDRKILSLPNALKLASIEAFSQRCSLRQCQARLRSALHFVHLSTTL